MLKIMHIVGARPNFPKVAPIMAEMAEQPDRFAQLLVHTGQHYDYNMSQVFFDQLEMPAPDEFLFLSREGGKRPIHRGRPDAS